MGECAAFCNRECDGYAKCKALPRREQASPCSAKAARTRGLGTCLETEQRGGASRIHLKAKVGKDNQGRFPTIAIPLLQWFPRQGRKLASDARIRDPAVLATTEWSCHS